MKHTGNIVLLAASWTCEYHTRIINGICEKAKESGYTVSIFVCQDGTEISEKHLEGEYTIFSLPELERYDGAILFAETISSKALRESIVEKLRESKIPTIALSESIDGMGYVGIDNFTSMTQLLEHMHEKHNARKLTFVGGQVESFATSERLRAFLDFTARYKIKPEDCRILYCDYTFDGAYELAHSLIDSKEALPDAFICANDKMAIGFTSALREQGYRVPEDVAVTGFDGSYDSEDHALRITTVDRPKEEVGYRACEALLRAIHTGELEQVVMDTKVSIRESCGCIGHNEGYNDSFIRKLYVEKMHDEKYNRLIRDMDNEMMECETLQELVFCVRQSIGTIQQEEIWLCLNASVYFDMTSGGSLQYTQRMLVKEYDDQIYATKISHEMGLPVFEPIERKKLAPKACIKEGKASGIYLYIPLHFRDNCFGYLVLTGAIDLNRVPNYYAWIHNISNSLENLQNMLALKRAISNIDNMAVKDSLTGVYNRTAINRFVVDTVKQANQAHKTLLFVFADVDHLKKINDVYGHEAGDQAICLVSAALIKVFGTDELIIRYGGDEFLIVTSHFTQADIADRKHLMQELLDTWAERDKVQYPLRVSMGCYYKEQDTVETMEQYIDWADENMYQDKCQNRKEFEPKKK